MSKRKTVNGTRKAKLMRYGLVFINSATGILAISLLFYYFVPTTGRTDLEEAYYIISYLPFISISLLIGSGLIWLARRNEAEGDD